MNCFKCLKNLEPVFPDSKFEDTKQPSGGLIFAANGNYGSRVWDPTTRAPELIIWICDECIVGHGELVEMRRYAYVRTQVIWNDFDPERAHW